MSVSFSIIKYAYPSKDISGSNATEENVSAIIKFALNLSGIFAIPY